MPFSPANQPPQDRAFADHLVVRVRREGTVHVVRRQPPDNAIFLGTLDECLCWAEDVEVDIDIEALDRGPSIGEQPRGSDVDDEPDAFADLRQQWGRLDEQTWTIAGRGVQLVEWQRTHRFCGRCATPNEPARGERALRCPACGLLAFPRLAPAVIMLVERDDGRVLLARNVNFPLPMYSLLAGFVEPGETMEQAVARETLEEVGITVDRIEYWGSQPWPFPHSLMVGFRARYVSGDLVLQEDEIADAGWYDRDDLPMIPPPMSIARSILDAWIAERP